MSPSQDSVCEDKKMHKKCRETQRRQNMNKAASEMKTRLENCLSFSQQHKMEFNDVLEVFRTTFKRKSDRLRFCKREINRIEKTLKLRPKDPEPNIKMESADSAVQLSTPSPTNAPALLHDSTSSSSGSFSNNSAIPELNTCDEQVFGTSYSTNHVDSQRVTDSEGQDSQLSEVASSSNKQDSEEPALLSATQSMANVQPSLCLNTVDNVDLNTLSYLQNMAMLQNSVLMPNYFSTLPLTNMTMSTGPMFNMNMSSVPLADMSMFAMPMLNMDMSTTSMPNINMSNVMPTLNMPSLMPQAPLLDPLQRMMWLNMMNNTNSTG
ncbi:unnamed protein product [Bursaphelenchus okinawaensis]|uniref:Uncharacterized protein n=1 Tax=Bursaphelenchus okinawaensis TaxID=465554 RepID=A0A811KT07_9BILA|nr:unnamed protein product [Bursaphelenchus okinawaensis]CAG9112013.1 unnamed protein product [Bursaphelenchus okinawaensis]